MEKIFRIMHTGLSLIHNYEKYLQNYADQLTTFNKITT